MTVESWLRLIAGAFVMLSVALGAFVRANLFQSALTGWCPMMSILRSCGVKEA